jgi:O-antigen/teichoic acid export membrane protein
MSTAHGKQIKKFFSHSVIYGLGAYLDKIVGFLLIPLYTRYLVPADYGVLNLLNIISSIGFIFLNMGQSSALFRSYFDHKTEEGRQSVISTATLLTLSYSLPFLFLYILYARQLSLVTLGDPQHVTLVILVGVTVLAKVFLRIPFALLRAKEKSGQYAFLSTAKGFVQIALTLLFVVGLQQGTQGVLLGNLGSEAIFCLVLLLTTLRAVKKWSFSKATAKDLLSFGAPLVPAGVAGFVLNLSDRYFLKHYSTLHDVGLYSLGYRVGEIVWEVVSAIQLAYPPFILSNEKSPSAPQLYARVVTYYFAGIGFLVLALSVGASECVRIMAAPEYHDAYVVIPIIALAQLFRGFVYFGPVGLTLKRKTTYHATVALIAGALNLLLNYLWISSHGMLGAAWATIVSFFVQMVLINAISQRHYPIPYEYGRLVKLGLVMGGIYLLSLQIPSSESLGSTLTLKALLLLSCPFLLALLGFFQTEELASVAGLIRTVRGRVGFAG